jgi:hypothetical protein
MNNHFYVTLPSDSSATYYPNNTVARFVTKLPERIRLEGDYEVGLAEIVYPHSWYNIDTSSGDYWMGFESVGGNIKKFYLDSGYYANPSELAHRLTQEIAAGLDVYAHDPNLKIKFIYDATLSKFKIDLRTKDQLPSFYASSDFQRLLGFDSGWIAIHGSKVANNVFELNRGLNLMYVYCDVAAHTVVGDTKTPLLRVCNVTGNHGEAVRQTYIQPHYVPVGRREFDSIEIAINNEHGKPIPFEYGKSVITLHFRRRHNFLKAS